MVQNTCKYYHKLIIFCKVTVCHYKILIHCSLLYMIYKIYQMGRSVAISLSSLSLGPERKVKCYHRYFILSMDMYFILKNTCMEERHTIAVFMLRDRLVVSLKSTTMVNQKRSLNCNIIVSRIECFYSNTIGMTPLIEELEQILTMVWSKSTQKLDSIT